MVSSLNLLVKENSWLLNLDQDYRFEDVAAWREICDEAARLAVEWARSSASSDEPERLIDVEVERGERGEIIRGKAYCQRCKAERELRLRPLVPKGFALVCSSCGLEEAEI